MGEVLILKKKIRNNYGKIRKKKDIDVDANVTQLEHNNNKYGVLAFIYCGAREFVALAHFTSGPKARAEERNCRGHTMKVQVVSIHSRG